MNTDKITNKITDKITALEAEKRALSEHIELLDTEIEQLKQELEKEEGEEFDSDEFDSDEFFQEVYEDALQHMDSVVHHPNHYNQYGDLEVIDIIAEATKNMQGDKGYVFGNILKYLLRAPFKGKFEEDVAKANWYWKYYKNMEREVSISKEKRYVYTVTYDNEEPYDDNRSYSWGRAFSSLELAEEALAKAGYSRKDIIEFGFPEHLVRYTRPLLTKEEMEELIQLRDEFGEPIYYEWQFEQERKYNKELGKSEFLGFRLLGFCEIEEKLLDISVVEEMRLYG